MSSFPVVDTCRPVLSDVNPLAAGIDCTGQDSCEFKLELGTSETYSSRMGFRVGTKISAEANIFVVKASIEATFDASYEHTWGSGKTETKTYTYNLKRGDRCTPSMVHLDLECGALVDTVY